MQSEFKRLAVHTSIYGLASVLNASLSFFLTPLYARYLIPADFGTVTIFTITATFGATLLQLGTGTAIFRSVIQRDIDKRIVLSTALYFTLALTAPFLGVFLLFSRSLSDLLFGTLPDRSLLLGMAFIASACDAVVTIPLAKLRIEERSILYSLLACGNFLLGIIFNIYFVVIVHMGVRGIITANLCRASIYMLGALIVLLPDLLPVFSFTELKELVRFGAPIIPISIAALILSVADRYFLQHFTSLTEVGIYSVGYKLGSLLQLPIGAFQIAWPTIMFSVYKTPNAKGFYTRLLTYFYLILGAIVLVIAIFAREAIHVIAAPGYYNAWRVVTIVAISQIALGTVYATAVGINVKKRPEHILVAWILGVSVHLGLNYIIIPAYGMKGAAISTMIGYTIVAIGATIASQRLYPIPYQYKRLLKLAVAFTLVYVASLFLPGDRFGIQSIPKFLLLGAFPVVLWALGFFTESETTLVKSYLHILTRRPSSEQAAKPEPSEDDQPRLS